MSPVIKKQGGSPFQGRKGHKAPRYKARNKANSNDREKTDKYIERKKTHKKATAFLKDRKIESKDSARANLQHTHTHESARVRELLPRTRNYKAKIFKKRLTT